MKIDYIQLLRDSFNFTWKYKVLWIFGFIISLLSSLSNVFERTGTSTSNYNEFQGVDPRLERFFESPSFLPILLTGLVIGIISYFVIWYITKVSQAALTLAVNYDRNGEGTRISFRSLWSEGNKRFVKVLKYDLFWLLLYLPLIAFIAAIVIGSILLLREFAVLLLCFMVPVIFLVMLPLGAVYQTGFVILLLENRSVIESIQRAWNIFKNNVIEYILATLTFLLGGCAFLVVFAIISAVAGLFFLLPAFFAEALPQAAGTALQVLFGLLYAVLISAVLAPFQVFATTYLTKFILRVKGDNQV